MTPQSQQVLREALDLPPIDRAELVERILASFEFPAHDAVEPAVSPTASFTKCEKTQYSSLP